MNFNLSLNFDRLFNFKFKFMEEEYGHSFRKLS